MRKRSSAAFNYKSSRRDHRRLRNYRSPAAFSPPAARFLAGDFEYRLLGQPFGRAFRDSLFGFAAADERRCMISPPFTILSARNGPLSLDAAHADTLPR